jgi:hypothetical protein
MDGILIQEDRKGMRAGIFWRGYEAGAGLVKQGGEALFSRQGKWARSFDCGSGEFSGERE